MAVAPFPHCGDDPDPSGDDSLLGHLLRYVRYAAVGVAGLLGGPVLFVRLGLAETTSVTRP
jgi:hypothetical protein